MNVLYDHQIFWYQKYGGISNYFASLMSSAQKNKMYNFELSAKFSNNPYILGKSYSNAKPFLKNIDFTGKRKIFSPLDWINRKNTLDLLASDKFDVFHPTYYQDYFIKTKIPFVVTVYDLTMEIFNDDFSKDLVFASEKKKLFDKASKIIAISKNTKKDLMKYYNTPKEKIDIVYLASNKEVPKQVKGLPKKFILFVGARGKYKNFDFFVKSIAGLLRKDKELFLVCVGVPFSSSEAENIKKLKILGKVRQVGANSSELSYIYSKANTFVFPSLYEGFGLPILEAMQNNCPVAISNTSCFPEVAKKAGVYFDPKNEKSISTAIESIIYDKKKSTLLKKKGLANAKSFSWEKCAKETKKVYGRAIK